MDPGAANILINQYKNSRRRLSYLLTKTTAKVCKLLLQEQGPIAGPCSSKCCEL